MTGPSRFLEDKLRTGSGICSAQVVFVDVVAYSRRKSHAQVSVIDAFNKAINGALTKTAQRFIGATQALDVQLRRDIVILPLGDGAAIVFPFDGLPDLHLYFVTQLFKILDERNSKHACDHFREHDWCDCHASFLLRCGVSEGRIVLFRDLNDNMNVAGDTVNMAARVMGLADPGQVFFTADAHRLLTEHSPGTDGQFLKYETTIKHGIKIVAHQYVSRRVRGLNVSPKAGFGFRQGAPEVDQVGPPAEQVPEEEDADAARLSVGRTGCKVAGAVGRTLPPEVSALERRMVLAPGGAFLLGNQETGRFRVEIPRPFLIDKFPVTQALYAEVMTHNPSRARGAQLPVDSVSWQDAVLFCNRLSVLCGLESVYRTSDPEAVPEIDRSGYRLPTETEWEYACRAGTSEETYGPLDEIAWYSGNSGRQPRDVGLKKPNPLGLFDMLGNVWEWCNDWFQRRYPADLPLGYSGPRDGVERVLRGGSWDDPQRCVSASYRHRESPRCRHETHGFRVVLPWSERRRAERRLGLRR